jgi:hypothetical protein
VFKIRRDTCYDKNMIHIEPQAQQSSIATNDSNGSDNLTPPLSNCSSPLKPKLNDDTRQHCNHLNHHKQNQPGTSQSQLDMSPFIS